MSLFVTLAAAHLMMLAGRDVPLSVWSLPAYTWQDAALALGFGAYSRMAGRPRFIRPVYAAIIAYAALNVAVVRVLPSPLTPAMLRAASGTLADSITPYLTAGNLLACLAVLIIGAAVPALLRRIRAPYPRLQAGFACALVAVGPFASARVDTQGWDRNAFGALLPERLPAGPAREPAGGWRRSPFGERRGTDLSALRGAARGRNVVLVVLESTGADYLEPYGAREDPMPNLTALARRGVLFESAYAAYPESIRGLFAVLCSRHPVIGVPVDSLATADCDALPRLLGGAGYQTALFHSGRFSYLGMRGIVGARGFETLADAGTLSGRHDSSFGIDEATTLDAMLSWIDARNPDRPFFLMYLPIAGHHPYATTSPGPYPPKDERSRYLNALHEADQALGRLVDGLMARGIDGDTVYVVFGDHGEAFGQHAGNVAHSFFVYEENVRIPFLIAAPGLVSAPARASQTVSVIDTAPTLLDLLGLPVPQSFEGATALDGQDRMAYFATDYAESWLGLVDDCWKLELRVDDGKGQLFDICADPGETRDIAALKPGRAETYSRRLTGWARAERAALRPGEGMRLLLK